MPGVSAMKSAYLMIAILLLAPCLAGPSSASTGGHLYVFQYENVLGTSLEIKVAASSQAQSEKAEQAALAEIDREARILSSWDPGQRITQQMRFCNYGRARAGFCRNFLKCSVCLTIGAGLTNGALDLFR